MRGRWELFDAIFVRRRGLVALLATALGISLSALSLWRDEGPTRRQPPQLLADIPSLLPWWAWLLILAGFACLIVFEGAYQAIGDMQKRLDALETHVPHNRDSLVAAISDLESSARESITGAWVLRETRRIGEPDDVLEQHCRDLSEAYAAARKTFVKEARIAGLPFRICLNQFMGDVAAAVGVRRPREEIASVHQDLKQATEGVLRRIDSGGAYQLTPSTESKVASRPQ